MMVKESKPKLLVVGQEVRIFSGCYGLTGKVVKITKQGTTIVICENHGEFRFFDDGWGCDEGTHECGPWQIEGALPLKGQALAEYKAKIRPWWK